MFGRATIRLGIGPHSSLYLYFCVCKLLTPVTGSMPDSISQVAEPKDKHIIIVIIVIT